MEDPIRLCEQSSDELALMLLEAGRQDAPSATRLNGMLGAIGAAGATLATSAAAAEVAAGAAATAAGAQSSLPIAILVKWTGIGVLAGLATTLGVSALNRERSDAAHVSSSTQDVAPADLERVHRPSAASAPQVEQRSGASQPLNPRARAQHRMPYDVATDDRAPRDDAARTALREEVAALAVAKAALNRNAPRDAIQAVLGYRARFPRGHLMPEAAVIEMEAQLALGNRSRAVELGRELEKTPTPGGERARELLREATR